jgi:cell division protein FtsQ
MDGEEEMYKPVKKTNELIKRRKRKIMFKRSLLISMLLLAVLITLCLKLPAFNIVNINVINNKYVSTEIIEQLSGITRGKNIFYLNKKMARENITSNSYIAEVKVQRRLPDTVVLEIKEREAKFFINVNNKFFVLDKNGLLLEIRDNIDNFQLVRVDGINIVNEEMGKIVSSDIDRQLKVLSQFADLLDRNISGIVMDSIDIANILDIKIYSQGLCFKIGDDYEMEAKLNRALNIAAKDEVRGKQGYIDVSFSGNPVLYTE